jgi:NTE family protein
MKPLIGLALGSGVARGWAHIGVLRALERANIQLDMISGTSIGALIGGVYLAGHLGELEDWALQLNRRRLSRLFDFQLGSSGLIAGRRVMRVFPPDMLALNIEELPTPFVCVGTDLVSGHEVWLRSGNLVEAIRASYALPGLFPPVRQNGQWLIDGALTNPVPVSVCRAMGAHITIAVNLNGEAFGESPAEEALDFPEEVADAAALAAEDTPTPGLLRRFFGREKQNEPSVFAVMARSLHIVQDRISRSRLAGDPPDVTIFPKLGDVGILEFHRAQSCIAAGDAAATAMLPKIKELVRRMSNGDSPWDNRRRNGREG